MHRYHNIILVLLFSVISTAYSGQAVHILKHPYPFKASFTVISDLHRSPVEAFEAVHKLINSTDWIIPGSREWQILRFDQSLNKQSYARGVQGFGFPFADTFWFYDKYFGFFKSYDIANKRLIPHKNGLDKKFLQWYRKGYIAPLHDFGVDSVTRPMAKAAVDWMLQHLPYPVTVNLNHSKSKTPSGVARPCCTLLNQILVHMRYRLFSLAGQGKRLAEPKDLYGHLLEIGTALLFAALILGALAVWIFFFRKKYALKAGVPLLVLAAALLMALQISKVDYYKGDNPDSEFYNLDLMRRLGVRYFWTVNSDYWKATVHTIALPEEPLSNGRSTIFKVYTFDDQSKGLFFLRNTVNGKSKTLRLLKREQLQHLVDVKGTTILYLHWLSRHWNYFNEQGLSYLRNLKSFSDDSLIWLASGPDLLQHAYAYSYLNFDGTIEGDTAVIRLNYFEDPIAGKKNIARNDVNNLSFECPGAGSVKVYLNNRLIPDSQLKFGRPEHNLIVTILKPNPANGND